MKIICVTGMPGSGKSLVSEIISSLLKIPKISMGDIVRREARKKGIPSNIDSMMNFAEELRKKYGKGVVAELTMEYVKRLGIKDLVVIDGVRSIDEVNVFRRYGDILIIAVHASPKTRYLRLKSRGRQDDPKTWSEFAMRDLRELNFGIGAVIALADIMVVNEGKKVEELREEIKSMLRKVLSNVKNKG